MRYFSQRGIQDSTLFVELYFLKKGLPQAHGERALHLPFDIDGVDGQPAVMGVIEPVDVDLPVSGSTVTSATWAEQE